MLWQKGHHGQRERVFVTMEWADTTAGQRGHVCIVDFSATTIALGKVGRRASLTRNANNVGVVGALEKDVAATPSGSDGAQALIQCYGYHNAVQTYTVTMGAQTAGTAWLTPSGIAGLSTDDATLTTTRETVKAFAVLAETTTGGETSVAAVLRCM
jgi:hypothetical protein